MANSDQMPKIDLSKLRQTDLDFIKYVEQQNRERVAKLKRIRRNNLLTGGVIGVGVLSIYLYSMFAVKQERFLDDFDEPAKVIQQKNN